MANPGAVSSLQVANPALGTVSRLPQTSDQSQAQKGAPFVRLSRHSSVLTFDLTSQAFGTNIVQNAKPVGGYVRRYYMELIGTGGVNAGTTTAAADAPYNIFQLLLVRDPFNQPIINIDGYGQLLINLYSGQLGWGGFGNLPSANSGFSNVAGGAAGSGNFTLKWWLPIELDGDAYCSLPSLSAASQPTIQMQLNTSANFYTAAPTTLPVIEVKLFTEFWAAPVQAPELGPPDVGSSAQWSIGFAAQGVASAANQRIQLPRVGTFEHTLILLLRDSAQVRQDNWPLNDLTLWVDGVPIQYETFDLRASTMLRQFGVTRPTGAVVYSWRDSAAFSCDQEDTHDLYLYTTPATLLEVGGTFQTIASAPGKLIAYTGELYPVAGIPYTHLAD